MTAHMVIVTPFGSSPNSRPELMLRYFERKLVVTHVTADFNHATRTRRSEPVGNQILVPTPSYEGGLSLRRILSHVAFSIRAVREIERLHPDLVYVAMPPNVLGFLIVRYCRKSGCKVVTDIVDMWPESLPMNPLLKGLVRSTVGLPWRWFRECAIKESDFVLTESSYFFRRLGLPRRSPAQTVHLAKADPGITGDQFQMGTTIRIAYIGKMGHIQDFESLIVICRLLSAKVPVEVILVGGGERAEWLREELRKLPIKVSDHGYVWDQGRLADILTTADFGFNGYRLSAEVALSYKSMDYLSCGCALINSAKGDTWELVEQYRAGLNYAPGGTEATAAALLALSAEQRRVQRENALGLFREHFSLRVMNHAMDGVLEHIMRPNDA